MEKNNIIKIAILGAESTGKSDLCFELSKAYNTVFVREYAREYFNHANINKYTLNDLVIIAKKQLELEKEEIKKANKFLFCDTNLITLKIWAELEFLHTPKLIKQNLMKINYNHYLITDNDLPWIKDKLRQNKFSREVILEMNKLEAKNQNVSYSIISGLQNERLKNAIKIIDALF